MNKTRVMTFPLLMMMVIMFLLSNAAASERNIYVGDIVELKISSQKLTEEVIRDKFRDFENKNCWVIHGPQNFQRITIRAESAQKAYFCHCGGSKYGCFPICTRHG